MRTRQYTENPTFSLNSLNVKNSINALHLFFLIFNGLIEIYLIESRYLWTKLIVG